MKATEDSLKALESQHQDTLDELRRVKTSHVKLERENIGLAESLRKAIEEKQRLVDASQTTLTQELKLKDNE